MESGTRRRVSLRAGTGVSLAIKCQGEAEIFGAELALGRTYLFGAECKAAVFTWHGCTLEMNETPMVPYVNMHLALEQMRVLANRAARGSPEPPPHHESDPRPPRVLIIGPENSGKTSACKILVNYAVRSPGKWTPMLVNLDTNDGGHTVPGTLSATSVSSPLLASSPASTLGSTATSAPTALSSSALMPLIYWFGFAQPKKSPILMERRMLELAEQVSQRQKLDPLGHASGVIIDSSASFASAAPFGGSGDQKYPLVKSAVDTFGVNIIVVVGHEKLHVEMQRLFGTYTSANPSITIVKIPKSGGVVEIDHAYRERLHAHQLRTYFYGTPLFLPKNMTEASANLGGEASTELTLSPYSSVLGFDDILIYRIGGESLAPSSALPIGAAPIISETKPVRVDPAIPGSGLMNSLLAVLTPIPPRAASIGSGATMPEPSDEEILHRDVAGFLLVNAIDIPNRKMTILAPSPGSLVGRIAVTGSFEWQDQ
ncbi:hypothetical protein BS47DRAFT_1378074 [Hydnum rufescens UP504]|uniref:Polynucleotide 5'-hydroxyl-kinase GRC3 n=1 Tax=Hydnum rufescens UP504 TaxID=1448309 RepID=A0A9P6AJ24_9AGAM|nr:hypothetical protein BS47DRAFT_1378074 [Hydnum rufescens UP504]